MSTHQPGVPSSAIYGEARRNPDEPNYAQRSREESFGLSSLFSWRGVLAVAAVALTIKASRALLPDLVRYMKIRNM